MAGLPIGQLVTAAIVVVVVLVSFKAGSGISHAADRISDIVGVPIGSPSIKAFTATPDGNGNMRFQLSLAHSTNNVGLQIYRMYTQTPDRDLANMTPTFNNKKNDKDNNVVYNLISSSDATGQKLESGVINNLCPKDATDKDGKFTAGENGCESSLPYKPGGYRFVAVLKKDGKVVDQKDALTGFYDEGYVEMLNKEVSGCMDEYWNCNVIRCKEALINTNPGPASPLELRRESGVLRKISNEFRSENGYINSPNNCGKVGDARGKVIDNDNDMAATWLVLGGCSDKDIDDLNIKVARARLLETANYNGIDSEDKYFTQLDKFDNWKKTAVEMTMSCTEPLGWLNAPVGAYAAMANLNWQFVPSNTTPSLWNSKVNAELDRVVGSLPPVIIGATAGVNHLNKQLTLAWTLPIGTDALTQYQLNLFYSGAALDKTLADAKKQIGLTTIQLPKQPAKGDLSFSYPDTGSMTSKQMGTYWFELTAVGSTGQKSSVVDVHTGIYDDNYLELYSDIQGVDDACGSGCDVIGRKIAALENKYLGGSGELVITQSGGPASSTYTQLALQKYKKTFDKRRSGLNPGCFLSTSQKISNCLPDEIDLLYRDVVTAYAGGRGLPSGKTTADLLKVGCSVESWIGTDPRYKNTGIKDVCDKKKNLKNQLNSFGWVGYLSR